MCKQMARAANYEQDLIVHVIHVCALHVFYLVARASQLSHLLLRLYMYVNGLGQFENNENWPLAEP
jgi:hypothetical protein